MSNPKRYCYRDPGYPRQAIAAVAFIHRDGQLVMVDALPFVFRQIEEVPVKMGEIAEEMRRSRAKQKMTLNPICLLLSLKLARLVPLKREYWDKPGFSYGEQERYRAFLPSLRNPLRYQFLVVPDAYSNRRWHFLLAAPFERGAEAAVETFMRTSDCPVCAAASHAALYNVSELMSMDWLTGETRPAEPMESLTAPFQ